MQFLILCSLLTSILCQDSLERVGGFNAQALSRNVDGSFEQGRTFDGPIESVYANSQESQGINNFGDRSRNGASNRAPIIHGSIAGSFDGDLEGSRVRGVGFQTINGDDSFEVQIGTTGRGFAENAFGSNRLSDEFNSGFQSFGNALPNVNSLPRGLNRNLEEISASREVNNVGAEFNIGSLGFTGESLGNAANPLGLSRWEGDSNSRIQQNNGGYEGLHTTNMDGENNYGFCSDEKVLDSNGKCVEPEVIRNIFFYSSPKKEVFSNHQANVPKPKLKYNVVVINSKDENKNEPIFVPPPQHKTVVLVLNEESEQNKKIIEVPTQPLASPEVYFVNYKEGDNPKLPGGIDLQTALASSQINRDNQNYELRNFGSQSQDSNSEKVILGNHYSIAPGSHNSQQVSDEQKNIYTNPSVDQGFQQGIVDTENNYSAASVGQIPQQESVQIGNLYPDPSIGQSNEYKLGQIGQQFSDQDTQQGINGIGSQQSDPSIGEDFQQGTPRLGNQYSVTSIGSFPQLGSDQIGNQQFNPFIGQSSKQGQSELQNQHLLVQDYQKGISGIGNEYSAPNTFQDSQNNYNQIGNQYHIQASGQTLQQEAGPIGSQYSIPPVTPDIHQNSGQFGNTNLALPNGQISPKESGLIANQFPVSPIGHSSFQGLKKLENQHSLGQLESGSFPFNVQGSQREFGLTGNQNSIQPNDELFQQFSGEFGSQHSFASPQGFGELANQNSIPQSELNQQQLGQTENQYSFPSTGYGSTQRSNQIGNQNSVQFFGQGLQQSSGNLNGRSNQFGNSQFKQFNQNSINLPLIQRGSLAGKFSTPVINGQIYQPDTKYSAAILPTGQKFSTENNF